MDRRYALHPSIRLLAVVAVATALPMMSLPALTVLAVLFLAFYRWQAADALRRLARGLLRLRWLFLAIFVLYGAFTPGTPLFPQLPGISSEGLSEGARHALVIANLLILVYLLLAVTPVSELVPAIQLLLTPLRPLGVDAQRIGLRLALALDAVQQLQPQLARTDHTAGLLDRAVAVIVNIENTAAMPSAPISIPELAWPRSWEWLLPLVLLVALHGWTP